MFASCRDYANFYILVSASQQITRINNNNEHGQCDERLSGSEKEMAILTRSKWQQWLHWVRNLEFRWACDTTRKRSNARVIRTIYIREHIVAFGRWPLPMRMVVAVESYVFLQKRRTTTNFTISATSANSDKKSTPNRKLIIPNALKKKKKQSR